MGTAGHWFTGFVRRRLRARSLVASPTPVSRFGLAAPALQLLMIRAPRADTNVHADPRQ